MPEVSVIGARLEDGLQVIRELERGLSSTVYLASDGKVLKAVKLFRPEHGGRARRELEIGRDLHHPNLNPIERAVELAGRPGVMMPLAPGVRLATWTARGAGIGARLGVLAGVADALAHLHGRGVVHRDVKPENILVDSLGRARLLDYDLAARIGDQEGPAVAGTIAYLSPEQVRGEAVAPATDLYSFGALVYQTLTGQVPFAGSVAEVLAAHSHEEPAPPSRLVPGLAALDGLALSLLAKRAEQRPASAAEVARRLREAAAVWRG